MGAYTLEEATELHKLGYVPVKAAEIEPGDRCAYKTYTGGLAMWLTIRVEANTVTLFISLNEGSPQERTNIQVWCEYPTGAVLVETFDAHSIVYVSRNPEELNA